MISDEERLKEVVRYKTEQLKLLAIAFISTVGGCATFVVGGFDAQEDLVTTVLGHIFSARFLFLGYQKHSEIKTLLKL